MQKENSIKQIVKEVLDEMEGKTISGHGQYRDILEGKLVHRLNHYVSGIKEEASHVCEFELIPARGTSYSAKIRWGRCRVCGMIKQ